MAGSRSEPDHEKANQERMTELATNTRDWRPVKAGVERVIPLEHEDGPMPFFELQVDLEDGPAGGDWADLFRTSTIVKAGDRSMMQSDPVLVGSVVTWTVSQPSLPHAEKFIRRRIEWANEKFAAQLLRDRAQVQLPPPPQDVEPAPPEELRPPPPPPPPQARQTATVREVEAVQWFLDRHRRAS